MKKTKSSLLLIVSLLLVFGIALPAGAAGFMATQGADEPVPGDPSAVEKNLTLSPQALDGRSYDGNAYAVLTDSGEFIFFRSTATYANGSTGTFTDLKNNTYGGRVFANVDKCNVTTIDTGQVASSYWPWHNYKSSIKTVRVADEQAISPQNIENWFSDCQNLVEANLTGIDTTSNASLRYLFYNCPSLTKVDFTGFDTSNGQRTGYMFMGCSALPSLDLSNFDTTKSTGLWNMFTGMSSLSEIKLGKNFSFQGQAGSAYQAILPFPDVSSGNYTGKWTNGNVSKSPRELKLMSGSELEGTWTWERGSTPLPSITRVESGMLMERNPLFISDGLDVFAEQHSNIKDPVSVEASDGAEVSRVENGQTTGYNATNRVWNDTMKSLYKSYFPQNMPINEYCKTGVTIEWPATLSSGTPVSIVVDYPCIGSHDGRPVKARLQMNAIIDEGRYGNGNSIIWLADLLYAGGYGMNLRNCEVNISFNYIDTGKPVNLEGSGLSYNSMNYYTGGSETLLLPVSTTGRIAVLDQGHMEARTIMCETSYDETKSDAKPYFEAYPTSNDFPDRLHNPPVKDFNKNSTYFTTTDPTAFHYTIGLNGYGTNGGVTGWFAFSSATLDADIPDKPIKTVETKAEDNKTAEIGETVTYTIKQPIPSSANMLETYKSLVFTDALPEELVYNGDLKVYDEKGADVTESAGVVKVEGNTVTYAFSEDYLDYKDDSTTGMLYIGGDMTFVLSGTVREHMGGKTAVNKAMTTFNNDWSFETNEVKTEIPIRYGSLKVSKTLEGDAVDPSHEFNFVATFADEGGNDLVDKTFVYQVDNADGEAIREGRIGSGGTFMLKGGESVTIMGIPEWTTWTVKEAASTSHGYEIKPVQGDKAGVEAETGVIVYNAEGTPVELSYTNVKNKGMGALKVSKSVAGDAADPAQDFTFVLTFQDEAGNELKDAEFTYTGSRAGTVGTGGSLQLRHGESVTIEGLPEGTRWSIAEQAEAAHGYEIEAVQGDVRGKAAESGTIAPGGTSEISYTNEKNNTMGGLRISKAVTGDAADANKLFHFQIRLYNPDGTELTDGEFSFTGNESGVVASGGTFPLKHGETVELAGVPEGTSWEVKEVAADAHGYEIEPVRGDVRGAEAERGTIAANEHPLLSYTNEKNSTMGSLTISKTVEGEGADLNREFAFTVSIGNDPDTSIGESAASEFAYTGSREGLVANGGTIMLKHGESVTIEGLPAGTPFEVTEVAAEGYTSAAEGATGTIEAKAEAKASFTNTYKGSGNVTPTPEKNGDKKTASPAAAAKSKATSVPKAGDPAVAAAAVVTLLAAAGIATIAAARRRKE